MSSNVPFAQMAGKRGRGHDGGPPNWTPDDIRWGGDPAEEATLGPGRRLRRLRMDAGYEWAAEAARAIGVNEVTYQHHENGTRTISNRAAARYASHFGVSPAMILYGSGAPVVPRDVPVMGAVIAAGKIESRMSTSIALPETTPAPPFVEQDLEALIVTTDDLYPAYRPGDVVFYAKTTLLDPARVDGRECVVETGDGIRLLRVIHRSGKNLWTLTRYQGQPETGVRLRAAAPVLWVQREAYAGLTQ